MDQGNKSLTVLRSTLQVAGALIVFFLAIQLMGAGFRTASAGFINSIDIATSNPFIGLFIGLLITAILQSSSTVTTLAVATVASGSLDLQQTIPIILGANIGTTLTSTIVSLSYITNPEEFRRALSAGSVHDFYNILIVLIIIPLELNYGMLSSLSVGIVQKLDLGANSDRSLPYLAELYAPVTTWITDRMGALISLIIAFVLLFGTIKMISRTLYDQLIGEREVQFQRIVFGNQYKAFGFGVLITSIVQSSSLVTSLVVPLVATEKTTLKRGFEFVMGANLGTTITAIIAAMLQSEAAISLAIAHFILNFFGALLFLNVPFLKNIPLFLADRLGSNTVKNRIIGFGYILLTFFVIPFALIYLSR